MNQIMKADWIMVEDEYTRYGTKQLKQGERLLRVIDIQRWAVEVLKMKSEEGNKRSPWDFLFTDLLEVQQGVFKWNEKSKSFRKVKNAQPSITDELILGGF